MRTLPHQSKFYSRKALRIALASTPAGSTISNLQLTGPFPLIPFTKSTLYLKQKAPSCPNGPHKQPLMFIHTKRQNTTKPKRQIQQFLNHNPNNHNFVVTTNINNKKKKV